MSSEDWIIPNYSDFKIEKKIDNLNNKIVNLNKKIEIMDDNFNKIISILNDIKNKNSNNLEKKTNGISSLRIDNHLWRKYSHKKSSDDVSKIVTDIVFNNEIPFSDISDESLEY